MLRLAWLLFISAVVIHIFQSLAEEIEGVRLQRWGKDDKYLCRCAKNRQCDKKTGECPNGECNYNAFGPACVFEIVLWNLRYYKWLGDRDLNTCRPPGTDFVKITTGTVVTVVRLVYRTKASFDFRGIFFYSRDEDRVCRTIIVIAKGKVKDIYCPSHESAEYMVIRDEALIDLCELYVSEGQNVALYNDGAVQSFTVDSLRASFALDSVYYSDRYDQWPHGCARTSVPANQRQSRAWWSMTFKEPTDVFRFELLNRERTYWREELYNFILEAFAENGTRIMKYKADRYKKPKVLYTIILGSAIRVKRVKVTSLMENTLLTLCEVMIYGVCPIGRYGPSCIYSCDHCLHNLCAELDGTCWVACKIGYNCSVANWFTANLQAGDSASAASTNTVWVLGLLILPLNACLLI